MQLIQLNGISNTWQRCSVCGHLTRPSILGTLHGDKRADFHCFRCYHLLAAVQVTDNFTSVRSSA